MGILGALLAAAALASSAPAQFALEAPPGWEDVTASRRGEDLVAALRGPESSSFILARVASAHLDTRGAIRAFLIDVLTELNKKSSLAFTVQGNVEETGYDNGAAIQYLKADLQGKPRLILGVIDFNGAKFLGTLNSAVPDTLLPSIVGSLREVSGTAARPALSRHAVSRDGQLSFALPEGVFGRSLTEREKRLNFVLAVQGLGSELMVMKIVEDATPLKEQPKLVRQTVRTVDGVDANSVSEPALLETAAGPDLVYAWGRLADGEFAAGYMPWGYWGYSILVKGPSASELLRRTFAVLELGPGAQPKLVGQTPRVPMPRAQTLKSLGRSKLAAAAAAAALALLVLLRALRRRSVVGAQ